MMKDVPSLFFHPDLFLISANPEPGYRGSDSLSHMKKQLLKRKA